MLADSLKVFSPGLLREQEDGWCLNVAFEEGSVDGRKGAYIHDVPWIMKWTLGGWEQGGEGETVSDFEYMLGRVEVSHRYKSDEGVEAAGQGDSDVQA